MRTVARPVVITAVVLAATLSLAGCAAGAASSAGPAIGSTSSGSSGSAAVQPDAAPRLVEGTATSGDAASKTSTVDRSVIVTGTVTVTTEAPVAAAARAVTIVEAAGGRVDARTENDAANGDRGSATLTLRIPAAKLSATLDALKKLGRADRVSIDSADVTTETQDLDARITALRATIARLLQLESTATDTTNLIAIETAIGDRQGELESLEAQQRGLDDQVSMSTITLDLRSDAAAPPIKPADFWSGLGTGWKAFAGFWAGALVGLGVAIPWLVLIAFGVAVVLVAARIARRRAAGPGASGAGTSGAVAATAGATPTNG
jgi:hypothetical protein